MIAALFILSAAICTVAQTSGGAVKRNAREKIGQDGATGIKNAPAEDVSYSYEFKKPEFLVSHIIIKHDADGRGEISFEKLGGLEPIVEPFELSESARARILALWDALNFLASSENYQAERQYPHLGTMRLRMVKATRERTAEFNWTNDPDAKSLTDEYRRAANQAIFVFDMSVAIQNQPLDSPKLLDQFDSYLRRNELSDPQQLIPFLRGLSTDERLPLMSRNHAERIMRKLEKIKTP
jgi:hypothetical protein